MWDAPSEIALRLLAAAVAGMVLGLDRELHGKATGVRTLGLVALGAAMVAIAAAGLPELRGHPDGHSRVIQGVIQGVMAGVGFIGAGVILRDPQGGRVKGMTTAANVWATAALGVVFGLGEWVVGGIAFAIAFVLLVVVKQVERRLLRDARPHR